MPVDKNPNLAIKNRPAHGCCLAGLGLFGLPVALVVGLLILYGILRGAAAILIIADPLQSSDAVVVLSGGQERIPEAVRLMRERYSHYLVLTETGEVRPGVLGSTDLIAEASRLGMPRSSILVTEQVVTSTHEEAVAVLHLLQARNFDSCTVVTDPFHTLRTRLIFRDVFRGSGKTVWVHPIPGSWYRSRDWFLSARGWVFTTQEYIKLIGFFIGL